MTLESRPGPHQTNQHRERERERESEREREREREIDREREREREREICDLERLQVSKVDALWDVSLEVLRTKIFSL